MSEIKNVNEPRNLQVGKGWAPEIEQLYQLFKERLEFERIESARAFVRRLGAESDEQENRE